MDNKCILFQYADDTVIFATTKDAIIMVNSLKANMQSLNGYFEGIG